VNAPTPAAGFRWSVERWGLALRCTPLEDAAQHLFTTRQLVLRPAAALGIAGVAAAQQLAWSEATASIGGRVAQLLRVKQVHGRSVRVLRRGQVEARDFEERPEADALVSNHAEVILAVQVADCVPILMADRNTGAAAAVHAGWRGTQARVAAAAVATMTAQFATRPRDLTVAIGPSIGPCCYQVGRELVAAFRQSGASDDELARWFSTVDGSLRLDLWSVTRDQLHAAGVPAEQIHVAGLCTQTHVDLFNSYRVEGGDAGRMAALIRVPTSHA
jgi:polyphenol oxidase